MHVGVVGGGLQGCCDAWMFFENDKECIATIATRSWTTVTI